MATQTQTMDQTMTQPQATAPTALNANQQCVVWGVVFQEACKADLRSKTAEEIHNERKELRVNRKETNSKAQPPEDANGGAQDESGHNNNGADNAHPQGRAKADRKKRPRISVVNDMKWAPIPLSGIQYPANLNARHGVAAHHVGPAPGSLPLVCNLEIDMFVFDRSVTGLIEGPVGTQSNTEPINVLKEKKQDRGKKDRKIIYNFLLRIKNVAFNLNDPVSILFYMDHLIRALQSDKQIHRDYASANRTVTFFSGPINCDHDDCEAWRVNRRKNFRSPGPERVCKKAWWDLAHGCLRSPETMTFDNLPQPRDVKRVMGISFTDAARCRAWTHALLRHITPDCKGTAFKVLDKQGFFPLIVDDFDDPNADCTTSTRATENDNLDKVVQSIDPVVKECAFCGKMGALVFDHAQITGFQKAHTGLLHLHFAKKEEDDEDMKNGKQSNFKQSSSEQNDGMQGDGIEDDDTQGNRTQGDEMKRDNLPGDDMQGDGM
ncbi:hypothetical protein GGS26DRAFT_593623 [Hypomontagnella submonticulosa]|nr:hypothetical protein GGS26DRAFT_593623 [Hypomontagnella submonticulosa]